MAGKPTYEELEQRIKILEKTESDCKQREEALRDSKARLQALSEAPFEAIFLFEKGVCLDQNQTAERMFGYTRAEAIGRHGTEWIVAEDREQVRNNMLSGYEKPYEATALLKDGTTFPCEIQTRMIDYKGRSIRVTALRDITERKQAEMAVRDSENKYRRLTENSPDMIYRMSLPNGKYEYVSPASTTIFGYPPEAWYENPLLIREIIHSQWHPFFKDKWNRFLKGDVPPAYEYQIVHKDGSVRWINQRNVLVRDENGRPVAIEGIVTDITDRKQTEEVLKDEAIRRSILVEQSRDGIVVLDQNGKVYEANQRYADMLGYSMEEVRQLHVWDWDTQWTKEQLMEMIQAVDDKGDHFETCHRRRDGTFIDVEISTNGAVCGGQKLIFCVCRDITDRKQAEEALRESEEKYRHLFETAMVGIYRTNLEDGKFLAANKSLARMMGYESVDTFVEEYITSKHYANPKRREELLNKLQSDGEVDGFEIEMIRADGSPIHIALSATVYPDRGYLEGAIIDITERKRTEEALRTSHERFLTVLDSIDATIYVADMETYEILFMNKHMIESFDRDMTGEICWDAFRKESEPCQHCTNDQLIDENGKPTGVCVWQDRNPITDKWYINYDRAIDWTDGRLVRLQIATDISNLKRMEEELRQSHKMESIGTLAGGIAHDFNNILGIILGNTELAMDDVPEWNPARLNLEEIRTASIRAKDVVRQLLSFARKTSLVKKPTDIIPIVKESLKLLRSSISTNIEIRQNISEDIGTILADPTQINQILINLCTNADHAMPNGGIIEVTLKNAELDQDNAAQYPEINPGRYVNLRVDDTGHGISQKEIDRIFDPYFTTKDVGKGTGMGLAVVHGIIKGHNGIITVESKLEKGTTFNIFFPVIKKDAIGETETDEELPSGSERILFVDDEDSIVRMGRKRLERLGYNVEATTSPIAALNLFSSKPDQFDLVVTDLAMPKMTGDQLVKEILNIRPDISIILCTGFSEKVDEKRAKAIGAADYIEKPFDTHDFAFKIRKVLNGK